MAMNTAPEGYERIYKHIDSKPYFLSWEFDTFLVYATAFMFGILFAPSGWATMAIIAGGIVAAYIYDKIKNSHVKGFFWHIAYMLGFKQPKTLPPSFMRIFKGA